MSGYVKAYNKLNNEQKRAVDNIDGPMLVLAGPGTGKTQLLSARVANILNKTDVNASNILCLTFTESGAQNMRERLRSFIGETAYDVTISTYHSFGSDIIRQYSDYFQSIKLDRSDDVRLERPIDELTQFKIISDIVNSLPYDDPLLSTRYYIKSVIGTISDLKQHLISPDDLRIIASDNISAVNEAQDLIDEIINEVGGISRKKDVYRKQYSDLLTGLTALGAKLVSDSASELGVAYDAALEQNTSKPLTAWKDKWLHKNDNDYFTLTDPSLNSKMLSLANIYSKYESALSFQALYDFNDMILSTIKAIKANTELKFNLQERYQYILLDEFQDTNPSQFELVKQITDHPVHEGRPNIMAVGDDDQAIFAFQGANIGNMTDFLNHYKDVEIINLIDNYRSGKPILKLAQNVAERINDRLHHKFEHINKVLVAKNHESLNDSSITRVELQSQPEEFAWVASKVSELHKSGVPLNDIAVICAKHKPLEELVPFIAKHNIPVNYEKRENILDAQIIKSLRLSAQLIDAIVSNDSKLLNQYFPLVLNLPFWQLSIEEIWKTNWQLSKYNETRNWAEITLENNQLSQAVSFYLAVAANSGTDPLEVTLDKLTGARQVLVNDNAFFSPLKEYYFNTGKQTESSALEYYESISHLSIIRSKIRDYQVDHKSLLSVKDFLDFIDMYESAEISLTNTHPVVQSTDSINLLTGFKAKGLEFEYVIILQAIDDMWGSTSTSSSNKLSLPINLKYIRYKDTTDDERVRLLFVAITRAKQQLYITSHQHKDDGKPTQPIKYLNEADGLSPLLPHSMQKISKPTNTPAEALTNLETYWQANQISLPADFKSLLGEILKKYRMSPTHLNSFLDVERNGPQAFLVNTLLRFPQAPAASGEFGTAVHNTLEWYQNELSQDNNPSQEQINNHYEYEINQRYLKLSDKKLLTDQGKHYLNQYISSRSEMFSVKAKAEINFYSDNVLLGDAHLTGKIDRLEIDEDLKQVRIVDYKTGEPFMKWNSTKGYKYKQQLYFYKILLENSQTWKNYRVVDARLEFVQPTNKGIGTIQDALVLDFNPEDEAKLKQLIEVVWGKIQHLDLPYVGNYKKSLKGIQDFEADLLKS